MGQLPLEHMIESVRQPEFDLAHWGIRVAEVCEYVRAPTDDLDHISALLCHVNLVCVR